MNEGTKVALFALASIVLVLFASVVYFQTDSLSDVSTAAVLTPSGYAVADGGTNQITGDTVDNGMNVVTGNIAGCWTNTDCPQDAPCIGARLGILPGQGTRGHCLTAGSSGGSSNAPDNNKPFDATDLTNTKTKGKSFETELGQSARKGVSHSLSEVSGLMGILRDLYVQLNNIQGTFANANVASATHAGAADTATHADTAGFCTFVGFQIHASNTGPGIDTFHGTQACPSDQDAVSVWSGSSTIYYPGVPYSGGSAWSPYYSYYCCSKTPVTPLKFDAVYYGGDGDLHIRFANAAIKSCKYVANAQGGAVVGDGSISGLSAFSDQAVKDRGSMPDFGKWTCTSNVCNSDYYTSFGDDVPIADPGNRYAYASTSPGDNYMCGRYGVSTNNCGTAPISAYIQCDAVDSARGSYVDTAVYHAEYYT